jgi:predicted amidohydrolase
MQMKLKSLLLETSLHWENQEENRSHFRALLQEQQPNQWDLIVLPEMFSTGFTMNTAVSEVLVNDEFPSVTLLKEEAARLNAAIVGSLSVREEGKAYNRLFFVRPSGEVSTYNKRHLFSFAGEHKHYEAGQEQCLVEWRGWNILLNICYDLRFPVWTRNEMINEQPKFDLMIYVANWPSVRAEVWKTLLKARAIENVAYVIGVNRIGEDGNGHAYSGDSAIVNFRGELTQELSLEELNAFREKFPALNDADSFQLK